MPPVSEYFSTKRNIYLIERSFGKVFAAFPQPTV